MRTLRDIHLYLGCVFAPLLIFYSVTGAWQCFDLHKSLKGPSYTSVWVKEMTRLHMNAKVVLGDSPRMPGNFRYYVLAMAVGLVSTTILGIILAFQVARKKWLVCACLGFGVLFPIWLVYG